MPTHHSTEADATIDDPFLLDNEHIELLADPGRIRGGLQLSTDHAVTALLRHEAGLYDHGEDAENGLWFWPQKTISRPHSLSLGCNITSKNFRRIHSPQAGGQIHLRA